MAFDFSLFPRSEEWGSGDEAMDNKLSIALKKVQEELSFEAIEAFYHFGLSLRPRAYNPSFNSTIEFVVKALLYNLDPDGYNNHLFLKLKGQYFKKQKIDFHFLEAEAILAEIRKNKTFRYGAQIDFSLHAQNPTERNPFLKDALTKSPYDLHVKILFKDFKTYLSGEKEEGIHQEALFRALRMKESVLSIENFGELWYHGDQIFSLTSLT